MENLDRMNSLRLEGNGWELPRKENASVRAVLDQVRIVTVADAGLPIPRPSGRDLLARDAMAMIGWLKNPPRDASHFIYYTDLPGEWLIFAVHLNAHGLTAEANELTDVLIKSLGGPDQVIPRATSRIADARYDAATDTFLVSGDWLAYATEINRLLAEFPSGWSARPLVEKVADALETRRRFPIPPAVKAKGLTEEDQRIARELAGVQFDPATERSNPGLWLLNKPEGLHPFAAIFSRGATSLPLLIAMLEDNYLVAVEVQHGGGPMPFVKELDPDNLQATFVRFRRPATRSDLAAELLVPLLATEHNSDLESDYARIGELARQLELDIRGLERKGIIWYYLENGNSEQSHEALTAIIENNDLSEQDAARIEQRLLRHGDTTDQIQSALEYVTSRGPQARDFVDKFEAALSRALVGSQDSDSSEQYFKQKIEDMRSLVDDLPFDQVLADTRDGKRSLDQLSTAAARASQNGEPEIVVRLLHLASQLPADDAFQVIDLARQMTADKKADPLSDALKRSWETLLEDRRGHSWNPTYQVAHHAAQALLTGFNVDSQALINSDQARLIGPPFFDRMRDQALAKLHGQIWHTSTPSEITSEKAISILSDLLSASDLPVAAARLTEPELFAVAANLTEEARSKFAANAFTIVSLDQRQEVKLSQVPQPGDILTIDAIKDLLAKLSAQSFAREVLFLTITRRHALSGVEIAIWAASPDNPRVTKTTMHQPKGTWIFASCNDSHLKAFEVWPYQGTSDQEAGFQVQMNHFFETLQQSFAGKGMPIGYATYSFRIVHTGSP
jgi:hypothetical protein